MLCEGCQPAEIPAVLQASHERKSELGCVSGGTSVEKMEAIAFLCLRGQSIPAPISLQLVSYWWLQCQSFLEREKSHLSNCLLYKYVISMAMLALHLDRNEVENPSTQQPGSPPCACNPALTLAYSHSFLIHRKRLTDNLEGKQKSYTSPFCQGERNPTVCKGKISFHSAKLIQTFWIWKLAETPVGCWTI